MSETNWHEIGEDGMPVHLYPFPVTEDGEGPATGDEIDHFTCWCPDPECSGPNIQFPVLFDPGAGTIEEQREKARGTVGWYGFYPTTKCTFCGGSWFVWLGDWSLGYKCYECNRAWSVKR